MPNEHDRNDAPEPDPSDDPASATGSELSTLPLVGLGASAGGIEALGEFFEAMPADSGLAFVVVLHLDPTQQSHLASILAQHTTMPVLQIEDGMQVAADRVHVIAPNRDLTIDGDTLRLSEPGQPRGHRHPVDVLFRSLAEQRQARGAAIVLSGTGTNGTQGLKEVKAAGGLILVQDPANLRFDGMPRSAIGAGLADRVLAPADMPAALLAYFRHSYVAAPDGLGEASPNGQADLEHVLALLRAQSGLEFRSYKPGTLLRRINRRMSLKGLRELDDYLDLLRAEQAEIEALVRDLLISVTAFFRDGPAWAALAETVLAPLVADRDSGSAIRVWVPACATGEEAYSVAMLLIEHADAAHKQFDIKIFASDVLDSNLNAARAGVYPGSSVEMLASERIRRFFDKLDGSYQVRSALRELVVFARQDLLREPPFSRMDLITCRNMLIYIEPEAQRRAIALFHFALREGGRLFLGSAETIGRADDLFETVSKKWRIYCRLGPTRHDIVNFPVLGANLTARHRADPMAAPEPSARATETARRALLERYAPAAVLIDQRGRVLYFHGETFDYLKQPSGEPTRDLLAMARDGLVGRLRGALQSVADGGEEVSFRTQLRRSDGLQSVRVTLAPLAPTQQASGLVLVTFHPEAAESVPVPTAPDGDDRLADVPALEQELRSTRSELQGTIEQLERLNEELKAANEEATSMNEELQSTNEELETSKEELQSFNEELHSINSQLQHKIGELDQSSNDLANLLAGTEIATVFLDMDLRIKWFSPVTRHLMELQTGDVGRPLSHFAQKFADNRLLGGAQEVLDRLTVLEAEIQSDAQRWYLRRILPYRTRDNRIAGLVLTFIDIHARKLANDEVNESRIFAEAIVATARQPLIVIDSELRVRSANRAATTLFGVPFEAMKGVRVYEVDGHHLDVAELRRLLEEVLPRDRKFEDVEIAFGEAGVGRRTMLLNGRRLDRNGGREPMILIALEDVTDARRAAEHQDMLIGELNHRVKNVLATVQAIMGQTLRGSDSLEQFAAAFEGRLHALAQAHNLLVEKEWVGADIGQVVDSILAPYRSQDGRILKRGTRLVLRPQVGVALMMVLHELATNAVKYGSLSVPDGRLLVEWHREDDGEAERLHVRWVESGGPRVRPPSRQGFGTRLIERSTRHELGGEAHLKYDEDGLRCELIFPWAAGLDRAAGVA